MKPAPFDYVAPVGVEEALAALALPGARALAGGQSLIPLLSARRERPRLLVDLERVRGLADVRDGGDGGLRLGAMTRQATLERDERIAAGWPLLRETARCVGHAATRTRGTVGGSVAHADPLAQLPAALLALGARLRVRGPGGERVAGPGALAGGSGAAAGGRGAHGPLAPGELLVAIELPPLPPGASCAFAEHRETAAGPVVAGAAAVLAGGCAALAVIGAADGPLRVAAAERALLDGAPAETVARLAAAPARDGYVRAALADTVRRALERLAP